MPLFSVNMQARLLIKNPMCLCGFSSKHTHTTFSRPCRIMAVLAFCFMQRCSGPNYQRAMQKRFHLTCYCNYNDQIMHCLYEVIPYLSSGLAQYHMHYHYKTNVHSMYRKGFRDIGYYHKSPDHCIDLGSLEAKLLCLW